MALNSLFVHTLTPAVRPKSSVINHSVTYLLSPASSTDVAAYVDNLVSNNFMPVILMPTRITARSATLIDHMYYLESTKSKHGGLSMRSTLRVVIFLKISLIIYQIIFYL